MTRFLATLALVVALLLSSAAARADAFRDALANELLTGFATWGDEETLADLATAASFYNARGLAPLWIEGQGANGRARLLADTLAQSEDDGLDPADYGAQAIAALLGASDSLLQAELEVRLTLALMAYASDIASGRLEPAKVDPETFVYPQDVDRAEVLEIAAALDAEGLAAYLRGLAPQQNEYWRLRMALADYRKIAADGGWPGVAEGETLKPGTSDPRIAQLRQRLLVTGELSSEANGAAPDPTFYDAALEQAVRTFQDRQGLDIDGAVGKQTLAALNVPVERRVEQMLLNMERRRWMPDDYGQRYLFVNIADFEVKLVQGLQTLYAGRVVVGTPYHRTPAFSDVVQYVEINPYWNVPPSIATKELLPQIRKNPDYVAAKNFELFSSWGPDAQPLDATAIDWSRVTRASFPYKLRQKPGADNALGRLKIVFPNHHNIYLHDTPARGLFARSNRAFSHGCIRLQDPLLLAELLLEPQGGWPMKRIEEVVESGVRTVVPLAEPIPVHLVYITAWVNKDGTVNFRNDVYGRDARLAKALLGPRATIR